MSKKSLTLLMRYLLSYQNTEIILWAAQVFFTNGIFIEIGVCFLQLSFSQKGSVSITLIQYES